MTGKLSILVYHRVLDAPDSMRPGDVDEQTFAAHVRALARYARVLALPEAIDGLLRDRLPKRAVSITFDDGYADNLTRALPILRRYRCTATFFIAAGFMNGGCMWNDVIIELARCTRRRQLDLRDIGLSVHSFDTDSDRRASAMALITSLKHMRLEARDRVIAQIAERLEMEPPTNLMLDAVGIRALADEGMSIGGHTIHHPILETMSDAEAQTEIVEGRRRLESIIGRPVDLFAYPNGRPGVDYSERHVELVRTAGFAAALSTERGTATSASDRYQLPRVAPWDRRGHRLLLRLLLMRSGRYSV